jgi:cytoskeletal protein RodZ
MLKIILYVVLGIIALLIVTGTMIQIYEEVAKLFPKKKKPEKKAPTRKADQVSSKRVKSSPVKKTASNKGQKAPKAGAAKKTKAPPVTNIEDMFAKPKAYKPQVNADEDKREDSRPRPAAVDHPQKGVSKKRYKPVKYTPQTEDKPRIKPAKKAKPKKYIPKP